MAKTTATKTRTRASDQLRKGAEPTSKKSPPRASAKVRFLEPVPVSELEKNREEAAEAERVELSAHSGEMVEVASPPEEEGIPAEEVLEEKRKIPKATSMEMFPFGSDGKVAIAAMTPDKLKQLTFISTYSSRDPQSTSPRQHGYQRDPMESRFPAIGRYYAKDNNRHRIPALVASVRVYTPKDQERFIELFNEHNIAQIHKEFGRSVFSMVDGQHRMGGLYWAWENLDNFNAEIPVTVYFGLTYPEEAAFFDTINTLQRKLPKALIEATKVHLDSSDTSHAQYIRVVAEGLAQDRDSVWQGLVNMTGARDVKLPVTYEGLRRATSSLLHERLVGRLRVRNMDPEDVAKRYWKEVSTACWNAWENAPRQVENEEGEIVEVATSYRIKDLVGVAALSKLGGDVIATALDLSKDDTEFWGVVVNLVSKLGAVDWEKRKNNPWMNTSAGFAGQVPLYEMLYRLVYMDEAPGVAVPVDEA